MLKQSITKLRNSPPVGRNCAKAAGLSSSESAEKRETGLLEHELYHERTFRVAPGKHAPEQVIEEYCFNRLSERRALLLERHLLECGECAARVREQQRFIACMKKALLGLRNAERSDANRAEKKSPILSVCAVAAV